jgi:single-strand DNA-binding protein
MNSIVIVGNLTRDPETRFAVNGSAVVTFTVAHNRRQKNDDGTWQDGDSSFIDCVAFGTLGEAIAETLSKGQRSIVAGRLQQRSWETPDGDRRSKVELVVDACGPEIRWAASSTPPRSRPDVDEAPF